MSGRIKQLLYFVACLLLLAAAFAAALWLGWGWREDAPWVFLAVAVCIVLRLHILLHEAGHVVFGLFCGMKFVSVRIGYLAFTRKGGKITVRISPDVHAGLSAFFPKFPQHLRGRVLLTALGGAVFNLLYAAVLLVLWLVLPHGVVLLFFAMLAPFSLYEGIAELIPRELPTGKTDGAVMLGIIKKQPEEAVMLSVLRAQALLYRGSFAEIPRELLFETPVVREDNPAFLSLLMLRMQYLLDAGEDEKAAEVLGRLEGLREEYDEEMAEGVAKYAAYFRGEFSKGDRSPLAGINLLEGKLASAHKQVGFNS